MRKMMSTVHLHSTVPLFSIPKAPDEVLKRCTHIYRDGKAQVMTDKDREEIPPQTGDGRPRPPNSGGARRTYSSQPTDYDVGVLEQDLCFIGLTGMIDPVRPEVRAAIDKCRSAGIRPIMITGDHIDTAVAIAKELGIITEDNEAVSGSMLEEMTDEEFNQRFAGISVYARVQPEHKVRIVNAWRSAGYVTAMTGDGVNDAPSIKSADIGVGMGITGTDVTKNVADMVLADDNFATIVSAVEEGRRIYDNIRKVIQFLLSCNTSEVISVFFATLLGFIILRPVHLLWINLITDSIPAMALGMEKAEPNLMSRPPRSPRSSVLAEGLGFDIVYQGLIIAVLTIASYFVGHYIESGLWEIAASPDGITMAFLTLSMIQIFHSINLRSRRESIFVSARRTRYFIGPRLPALR